MTAEASMKAADIPITGLMQAGSCRNSLTYKPNPQTETQSKGLQRKSRKKAEPKDYESSAEGSAFWYNVKYERIKIPGILSHKRIRYNIFRKFKINHCAGRKCEFRCI